MANGLGALVTALAYLLRTATRLLGQTVDGVRAIWVRMELAMDMLILEPQLDLVVASLVLQVKCTDNGPGVQVIVLAYLRRVAVRSVGQTVDGALLKLAHKDLDAAMPI